MQAKETCYDIDGEIETYITSATTQTGSVEMSLSDPVSGEHIMLTGNLTGNITGGDGVTYATLSHTITSDVDDLLVITVNDHAEFGTPSPIAGPPPAPILELAPCYIPIASEDITQFVPVESNIAKAKLVFINVRFSGWLNQGAIVGEPVCEGLPNRFVVGTLSTEVDNQLCTNRKIKM